MATRPWVISDSRQRRTSDRVAVADRFRGSHTPLKGPLEGPQPGRDSRSGEKGRAARAAGGGPHSQEYSWALRAPWGRIWPDAGFLCIRVGCCSRAVRQRRTEASFATIYWPSLQGLQAAQAWPTLRAFPLLPLTCLHVSHASRFRGRGADGAAAAHSCDGGARHGRARDLPGLRDGSTVGGKCGVIPKQINIVHVACIQAVLSL